MIGLRPYQSIDRPLLAYYRHCRTRGWARTYVVARIWSGVRNRADEYRIQTERRTEIVSTPRVRSLTIPRIGSQWWVRPEHLRRVYI